jgi:prepilin-type N-terminal cleavage/methylation domain-containing protein
MKEYWNGGILGKEIEKSGYWKITPVSVRGLNPLFYYSILPHNSRGFTLLELIIVMTLVSLMFGLSTVFFANVLPSARLGAMGRELSSAIRQMELLAQNRGEDQILTINLDTRQYGPEGGVMKTFPANISVMVNDPDFGVLRYGKYPMIFRATGGVEGGTVVLGYKKKILYIQADPVVGSVMIRQ